MVPIWFFGFEQAEIDGLMSVLVPYLALNQERCYAVQGPEVSIYNPNGEPDGQGKAVVVGGSNLFDTSAEVVASAISLVCGDDVPVTVLPYPVVNAMNGEVF